MSKQVCSDKLTSFHNVQEDSISIMKTSLRSSQPHSNSMHGLTTNLDNSWVQSYNFLKFRIENKIIIQKIKFTDLKGNTILFFIGF